MQRRPVAYLEENASWGGMYSAPEERESLNLLRQEEEKRRATSPTNREEEGGEHRQAGKRTLPVISLSLSLPEGTRLLTSASVLTEERPTLHPSVAYPK